MTSSAITVNLSAKKLEPNVEYNKFKPINTKDENKLLINNQAFQLQNIQEEVKHLSKQQRRKYLKIAKATLLTSASILMLVNPLFASAQVPTAVMATASLVVGTPTPDMIMPEDVMKVGLYLIGITAVLALIISILFFQASGIYRMMRKSKEATEWQTDIIKGLATTIIAPVLMVLVAFMAYLLFQGLPFFAKPF
jgi:hypothetical protein